MQEFCLVDPNFVKSQNVGLFLKLTEGGLN